MGKGKLGQDPLLPWIKRSQQEQSAQGTKAVPHVRDPAATADHGPGSGAPAAEGRSALAQRWPFVSIIALDMVLLLALGVLAYLDLASRLRTMRREVDAVAAQVEALRVGMQELEQGAQLQKAVPRSEPRPPDRTRSGPRR